MLRNAPSISIAITLQPSAAATAVIANKDDLAPVGNDRFSKSPLSVGLPPAKSLA